MVSVQYILNRKADENCEINGPTFSSYERYVEMFPTVRSNLDIS